MGDDVEEVLELGYFYLKMIKRRKKKKETKKKRKHWVKALFLQRETKGTYNLLLQELRLTDREGYFRYVYIFFISRLV